MQAIILAAGMGKRLKALTANNTKCMVKVNGVSLIERALKQLDDLGLERVVLVVGYHAEQLREYVESLDTRTPIEWVYNQVYDKTNNIYSLYLASDYLEADDTLLLESDLIFEDGVLRELVDDPRPTLALVDKYEAWMDGTVVKIDDDDRIYSFVPGKRMKFDETREYYKTVNIYKFSREFSANHYVPFLEAYSKALGLNEYYEQVLRVITMVDDSELRAKRLTGQKWYEIDDLQDLDIAESIFAPTTDEALARLQSRYGGYWRYPNMVDFCYLVNPYYPPKRMVEEMKASFDVLLTQYPSGQRVNSLLAAKLFGVEQSRVVVGNGAAEIIKSLTGTLSGKMGVVRPTFEEYPNRYPAELEVVYQPDGDDFSYGVDDLIQFFGDKELESLVLINPDNPTGNYIPTSKVKRLASWCEEEGIRLVYDESFADFSDEGGSLIDDEVLLEYPHMVVVKSISKSYGVPGARLGVAASADEKLISYLKKDVAIWNINSFGEFWLQIAEKYQGDYRVALEKLRKTRAKMSAALSDNPHLRVLPSQSNYLMVELVGTLSAKELTERLLAEDEILIKDLTSKVGGDGRQFVRLAVRTEDENERLAGAIASKTA